IARHWPGCCFPVAAVRGPRGTTRPREPAVSWRRRSSDRLPVMHDTPSTHRSSTWLFPLRRVLRRKLRQMGRLSRKSLVLGLLLGGAALVALVSLGFAHLADLALE